MMVPTSFIHGSRALYAYELKASTKFAMCSYVSVLEKDYEKTLKGLSISF